MWLLKLKDVVLDIFFPPLCLNCRKHLGSKGGLLCDDCQSLIKLNNTLFCPVCRARLADGRKICHRDSQYLLAAASNYDNPVIQNLIHYFKYKSFQNIAPILGEILVKYLEDIIRNSKLEIRNFVIIPVPLHSQREKKRGFNQAELLAKSVASHLNLPLVSGLARIRNNEPQVGLKDNRDRIENVLNCFQIKNPEAVSEKNIILVDDVFTSGATMNEAVKVLKGAGACRVIALVTSKAS